MADSVVLSRLTEGLASGTSLKKLEEPEGTTVVGEGRTSLRRAGGPLCASLCQIPLDQGKDVLLECPRPPVEPLVVPKLEGQEVGSVAGVVGYELTDVYVPLNEPLRCGTCWTSLSHDVRRTGFGACEFIAEKC